MPQNVTFPGSRGGWKGRLVPMRDNLRDGRIIRSGGTRLIYGVAIYRNELKREVERSRSPGRRVRDES